MIQFTVTLDGQKLKISSPHSWRELTLGQVLAIEDEKRQLRGLVDLFSIITSLDAVALVNSTDQTLQKKISDVCAFVADPPDWENLPVPEHIEIGGKVIEVPKKVSTLMHGQVEVLSGLEDLLQQMPEALASILAPTYYRDENAKMFYDRDQVEELTGKIKEAPGLSCYGIATFFFGKHKRFLSIGMERLQTYQQLNPRKNNYYRKWLVLNDSKSSAPSTQSTPS